MKMNVLINTATNHEFCAHWAIVSAPTGQVIALFDDESDARAFLGLWQPSRHLELRVVTR